MPRRLRLYLMALGAVLFWGASFPLTKALLARLGPSSIAFVRWSISALILLASLALAGRRRTSPVPSGLQVAVSLMKQRWPAVLCVALTGITLFYAAENLALAYTTATNASVLSNLTSVFMVIISTIWLHDRLAVPEWLALLLAFGGATLVSQGSGHLTLTSAGLRGDLLMVLASLCGAVYSLGARELVRTWPTQVVMSVVAVVGAICLLPLALAEGLDLRLPLEAWGGLVFLGLASGALANLWWVEILAKTTAARAGLILYFVPLVAATLGVGLLGEALRWTIVVGGALVLGGTVAAEWRSRHSVPGMPRSESAAIPTAPRES